MNCPLQGSSPKLGLIYIDAKAIHVVVLAEGSSNSPQAPSRRKLGPSSDALVLTFDVPLTAEGLRRLTPSAVDIESAVFQLGLAARSRLLGDPTKASDEGHPSKWVIGGPGDQLDALLVVAGDSRRLVDERALALMSLLGQSGIGTQLQIGDIRGDVRGREHFGFDDGVSQPGIRGRASAAPDDFVTDRWIDASEPEAFWRYGRPGQDLIWPGEFVLGYPASAADPRFPGAVAVANPPWARKGSFLVYRRLRQDVGLFWRTMRSEAERLSGHPGFEGLTDDRLAALLIGRWPSGAPVSRVPDGDMHELGGDDNANNIIEFDLDSRAYRLRVGADAFPLAKADPVGATCPLGAHIRKMNTRDAPSDTRAAAARVGDEVALAARLASVGRDRAGGRPPFLAGTLTLSSAARDQSI